jgi:hypothetical protein
MRIHARAFIVLFLLSSGPGTAFGQPTVDTNVSTVAGPPADLPVEALASTSAIALDPALAFTWHDADRRIVLHEPSNLREQGLSYGRIVLFIEGRNAPKTELVSLAELPNWLALNGAKLETVTVGNNLRANDIARFFNTAIIQRERLTQAELSLLEALLKIGVLHAQQNGYRANVPEHILISVPKVSTVFGCAECTVTQEIRGAILRHELAHARFFLDSVYRDFSVWYWSHGIPESLRNAFTKLLGQRGYDTSNRELLANEMQAYLMHTSNRKLFSAKMLAVEEIDLELAQKAFIGGLALFGLSE